MNNQNFAVVPLFSSPIFVSGEEFEMSESFLDFIKNVEVTTEEREHRNSVNSYILETKEFADLKKFIKRQLDLYVHGVLKITSAHNFYITQSWLNLTYQNQCHHRHNHSNSIISGVFYISTVKNDRIFVYDPNRKTKEGIIHNLLGSFHYSGSEML